MVRLLALIWPVLLCGCQIPYLVSSAYEQAKILNQREPIQKFLDDPKVKEDVKHKLVLVGQAREFAESELGLAHTRNYTQYVDLGRPYVSYIVHVAPAYRLEHYLWSFPIVGKVPYKGFFTRAKAEAEAQSFSPEKYDTFIRGVSAFSTLGWFADAVLSTMMAYADQDLVNTIIHETVHATLYIKGHADFNERLATFIGDLGTKMFFEKKEGADAPAIKALENEEHDSQLFSQFITVEMNGLKAWYAGLGDKPDPAGKLQRLTEMQKRFNEDLKMKLKTHQFDGFGKEPLNNARLLAYGTYFMDLSDFAKAYAALGKDFRALLTFCKKLEKSKDPEAELKAFVKGPVGN